MSTTADELKVIISAEVDRAIAGFKSVEHSLNNTSNAAKMNVITFAAVGSIISNVIGVVNRVAQGFKDLTEEYVQAEAANAQLEAVLRSTGYAAGLTADEVRNLAGEYQDLTGIDDDAILGAQNLLLTFKQIGEDVFPQATGAILDMSVAMGQDLKSTTLMVGKALNDPIAGMTALGRAGVQFTKDQKELIKTLVESGRIEEAQAIILAELESQFGGSAAAARDTFGGSLKALDAEMGNTKEILGEIVAFFGRDFVEGLIGINDKIQELTSNKDKMRQLAIAAGFAAASMSVIAQMAKIAYDVFDTSLNKSIEESNENMDELFKTAGAEGVASFQGLILVAKLLGFALFYISKETEAAFRNWAAVIKNSENIFALLGAIAKGEFDKIPDLLAATMNAVEDIMIIKGSTWQQEMQAWSAMMEDIDANLVSDAIKMKDNYTKIYGETVDNLLTTLTDGVASLNTAVDKAENNTEESGTKIVDKFKVIKDELRSLTDAADRADLFASMSVGFSMSGSADDLMAQQGKVNAGVKIPVELEISDEFFSNSMDDLANFIGDASSQFAGLANNLQEKFRDIEENWDEATMGMSKGTAKTLAAITAGLQALSGVVSGISDYFSGQYDAQIEALQDELDAKLKAFETEQESEVDIAQATLDELLAQREEQNEIDEELRLMALAAYAESLQGQTDADIEYALRKKEVELQTAAAEETLRRENEIADAQAALNEAKTEAALADEKATIEAEYQKKIYNLKKRQFEIEKAADIAQVWISTAMGIATAWATSMSLGPIAGPIVAGVLTGVLTGTAIAQTAAIAGKKMPALYQGTDYFSGSLALVGENGPEVVELPKGASVRNTMDTQKLGDQDVPFQISLYLNGDYIGTQLARGRRAARYGGY